MMKLVVALWIGIAATLVESSPNFNVADYAANDIITRDVCVIGGGSSGTYATIGLRDMGKSVVVVEIQDRLGGHTETYTDPVTKATIDYGVMQFHDLDVVKNYFARFDIPLTTAVLSAPGLVTMHSDFRSGKNVSDYSGGNPTALAAYIAQVAKYPDLQAGFYLSDPIPDDLSLPFGDFVKKYALEGAVFSIFSFAQGIGDLLSHSTLYVMKLVGINLLQDAETNTLLTTARHDNSELYKKATVELGADALLQTRVVATDRSAPDCVKILVDTPFGRKLIKAKKLVLTIPPKLNNLVGFDLDAAEVALFKQFGNSAYYTGLVRNTSIPDGIMFFNTGENTLYNLPVLPGAYLIAPTGVPGLQEVFYGSPVQLADAQVKQDIVATVKRLQIANGLPTTTPEFAVFSGHNPYLLNVPADAIEAGFYNKLYALQGQRHTYYTGAAFDTQDSSLLWQFTQALLPSIAA